MAGKSTYITLGLGALVIAGTCLLPINPADVRENTLRKLGRDTIQTLVGDRKTPELPIRLKVTADAADSAVLRTLMEAPTMKIDGGEMPKWLPAFKITEAPDAPELTLSAQVSGDTLSVSGSLGKAESSESGRLGDWMALFPPLIAILFAIALRRVVLALFSAVFVGSVVLQGGNPFMALWLEIKSLGLAAVGFLGVETGAHEGYLGRVLADTWNLQILGFTFALVGLVAVVSRIGGTAGLVRALSRYAKGPRSAQAVTSAMGTAIFFDDYANTVVVGTTARSLTDRFRISREKLAYIVDSTSAPVAGVAIISTWIGYEVGLFDSLLGTLSGLVGLPTNGYELFFTILPLRFYCLFALALVFLTAFTGRDFGPMYRAERRARSGGGLIDPGERAEDAKGLEGAALEAPGVNPNAWHAIIPIGSVLAAIFGWIWYAGSASMERFSPFSFGDWKQVFMVAGDDIGTILFGSSIVGTAVVMLLALGRGLLTGREAFGAYFTGIKTLSEAAAVLVLAWAIKSVCDDLGTGQAIVALVGDSISPVLLPLAVFILSGIIAFSTGSSWATMALVLPIAAPLAADLSGETLIVLACLGAVLDGAIWGDHCSPISDTTVLSSTATGCPHLAHVRTQLPYATLAMVAAGSVGYLGVTAGLNTGLAYLFGILLMVAALYVFGRRTDSTDVVS